MTYDTSMSCTQAEFGIIVGISQSAVSQLIAEGKIPADGTLGDWLHSYLQNLRYQIELRQGDGSLDLVQERAALARSQRISQDLKNDIARCEYAPIGLLADVLGMASSAVVDRFEQLEGALRKACPTLADDAKATVMQVIASARNEWIRSTAKLVQDNLEAMEDEPDLEASQDAGEDEKGHHG
jgi:hypothetical protein